MAIDLAWLAERVQIWAEAHYGENAHTTGLETMPGHAGLSFGFTVEHGDDERDELVMRVPPKGVKRKGNTDVIRQVPLLQALHAEGVRVPPVRWWSEDEQWFDVPYFMVDRLPGTTFAFRDPAVQPDPLMVRSVFEQAVDALVTIHKFDWRSRLADWEQPRPLLDEIAYWDPILQKAAEPGWITMGEEVRDLLVAQLPIDAPIGLFHGDFQTSNLLFNEGVLEAVLDWEISGIGGQRLDIGWLLMMNDPHSWSDAGSFANAPDLGALEDRYEEGIGTVVGDIGWYRALSGYRFGVISGLNVMLHRTGKRHDPEWERIALSVPFLFGRARDLLKGAT